MSPKQAKPPPPAKSKSRRFREGLARSLSTVWTTPSHRLKASSEEADDGGSSSVLEAKALAVLRARSTWEGTKRAGDASAFRARYELAEVLGEGGFGVVHHVTRKPDGEDFAAKCVEHRGAESWAAALEEAKTWSALSSPYHPSILPLLEVYEDVGKELVLLTEVMLGGDLTEAVFSVEMSEQACRLMCVQVASALAHLHCVHSYAHRDLKPHNVLCKDFDPTLIGSLKLADFGLAKPFTSRGAREFSGVCGTCDYWSPELAASFAAELEGRADPPRYAAAATDLWALGCLVYELYYGQPPFAAGSDEEVLQLIGACDLAHIRSVHMSADGKAFLGQLMAPDAAKRMAIEDALAHPWLQPVQDEKLRVQMAAPVAPEVATRREQTRDRRPRAAAAHGLSSPPKAARAQAEAARGAAAAADAGGSPPRRLVKAAASTKRLAVEQPDTPTSSADAVAGNRPKPKGAKGEAKASGKGKGKGRGKAPAGQLVDPMSHYVGERAGGPIYQTPTKKAPPPASVKLESLNA